MRKVGKFKRIYRKTLKYFVLGRIYLYLCQENNGDFYAKLKISHLPIQLDCEATNNSSSLTPFKKVLVRNKNDEEWKADIFYKIDKNGIYHCIGGDWEICIIYDENENLL